mgnify:CR=1 FL=1
MVSTHSRPKAAGSTIYVCRLRYYCFNTQPPEGGCFRKGFRTIFKFVSTHSRPKAAEFTGKDPEEMTIVSTHSRPKAAEGLGVISEDALQFQHTAARRRLGFSLFSRSISRCFNTQPPEGG